MSDNEFSNANFKFNLSNPDRDGATKVMEKETTQFSSVKPPDLPPVPKTATGFINETFPGAFSSTGTRTATSGSQNQKPPTIPNAELQQSRVSALHSMPEHSLFVPDQPLSSVAQDVVVVSEVAPSEAAEEGDYANRNWVTTAVYSLALFVFIGGGFLYREEILDLIFPPPPQPPALPAKNPDKAVSEKTAAASQAMPHKDAKPVKPTQAAAPRKIAASNPTNPTSQTISSKASDKSGSIKTPSAAVPSKNKGIVASQAAGTATPVVAAEEEYEIAAPVSLKEVELEDRAVKRPVIKLYADLMNPPPSTRELDRIWNAAEENKWRTGLKSKFPWQRYKTVMEVRSGRLTQSSVILWDALGDSKLWVRMHALIGLTEFGQDLGLNHLEEALGNADKGLIKRFFMRFELKSTPEDHFILRLAMGLVESDARLEILKTLIRNPGQTNRAFVLAAAKDSDPRISRLAQKTVATWSPEQIQEVQKDMASSIQPIATPVFEEPKTTPASTGSFAPAMDSKEDIENLDDIEP